jgi:hypothetical protein
MISIAALLISFLGTIFNILYSRRHLEIMKNEALVVERESAEKVRMSEALETVQNLIGSIDKHTNVRWFSFSDLRSLGDSIVRNLHDKRTRKLEITLRPLHVQWSILSEGTIDEERLSPSDSFEQFIDLFKKNFQEVVFQFKVTPEITENETIELGDPLTSIKDLYEALDNTRKFNDIIEKVDRSILTELEEALLQVLRKLYEELMKENQVTISASIQSDEICNLLLNKIVGYEALRANLEEIRGPLCTRLDSVQKELFRRA